MKKLILIISDDYELARKAAEAIGAKENARVYSADEPLIDMLVAGGVSRETITVELLEQYEELLRQSEFSQGVGTKHGAFKTAMILKRILPLVRRDRSCVLYGLTTNAELSAYDDLIGAKGVDYRLFIHAAPNGVEIPFRPSVPIDLDVTVNAEFSQSVLFAEIARSVTEKIARYMVLPVQLELTPK